MAGQRQPAPVVDPASLAKPHPARRAGWLLLAGCAVLLFWYFATGQGAAEQAEQIEQVELNPRRAYGYLVDVCRIGPRPSGSRGMARQQKLIADHFTQLDARVRFQSFDAVHPLYGSPVRMNNIVVSWHPESSERVLLACHYDTRPLPDRDRVNPRGDFIGANDGASGVALLMELGHMMSELELEYGVDFVFFDGEEFIFGRRGQYFLGSEHFAGAYRDNPPEHRYVSAVVVDMIGDRRLTLYQERNSLRLAPELTKEIWHIADRLGVGEFVAREKHDIQDDHLPLNRIAGIPACVLIDFDYPHWHTTRDLPSKCSGESLATVGRVLVAWLAGHSDKGASANAASTR